MDARSRWIRSRRSLPLFAAILLLACPPDPPPPAPPPPPPTPTSLPARPAADLWDAPRSVLAEAGFEVAEEDRDEGVLIARRHEITQTDAERRRAATELERISYLAETRLLEGDRRLTEYTVTVTVRLGAADASQFSLGAKAGIVVVVRPGGRDAKPVSRPIPSRGVLEKELIEKVRKGLEQ